MYASMIFSERLLIVSISFRNEIDANDLLLLRESRETRL